MTKSMIKRAFFTASLFIWLALAVHAEGHDLDSQTWVGFPVDICVQIQELEPNETTTMIGTKSDSGFISYMNDSAVGVVLEGNISRMYLHKDGLWAALTGNQSDTIHRNLIGAFNLEIGVLDILNSFEVRLKNGQFQTRVCLCNESEKDDYWQDVIEQNIRNGDADTILEVREKRRRSDVCKDFILGKIGLDDL